MITPDNLAAWRKAERLRLLAEREAVDSALRRVRNAEITGYLQAGFPLLRQMTTGFCWPFRGEFDARHLLRELRMHGARSALPEVVARDAPLVFREWWPGVATRAGVFGLPVPEDGSVVQPHALLIPMVGFDARGYRLGYGGGYFDRTLAACAAPPLKIGVAFELNRIPSIHPQPHDIPMDYIVTEAGIFEVADDGLRELDVEHCAQRAHALVVSRILR
ncbi:5-formyltetrahydrofolate cyclo-ligase [Methyloversatilis thermotolerans]|uniref:5-formyltetrahydrofolate cyclo-ligase n=1 Tax=Methyloversatilis thermotolerans TaxID=1346290 RepID=UPI00035CACCA|nr:5-formyltetrahydrofolate cyclo-ligase [Methyloversatilis thermotolerans]